MKSDNFPMSSRGQQQYNHLYDSDAFEDSECFMVSLLVGHLPESLTHVSPSLNIMLVHHTRPFYLLTSTTQQPTTATQDCTTPHPTVVNKPKKLKDVVSSSFLSLEQ